MSTTWIRVAYGVVLALILFFTVQFGIAMAIHVPDPPNDPEISFRQLTAGDSDSGQNTLTAKIDAYYTDSKDYRDDYVDYQRNNLLAGVAAAAILALIGVALPAAVNYLRWGFLLGAALLMLWAFYVVAAPIPNPAPPANSVLALVAASEPKTLDFAGRFLRFAVSFVGLIVVLFVGLWRLTEWPSSRKVVVTSPTPAAATTGPAGPPSAWAPPPPAPAHVPSATSAPPPAPAQESVTAPTVQAPRPGPATEGAAAQWQRPSDAPESGPRPDTAP